MQSQKRSTKSTKQKKAERPQLPWGMGSATIKGKVYWLTYRNAKGKVQYENSGTSDANEARRLLAMRALPRAVASVVLLEAIANEPADQSEGAAGGGTEAGSGRVSREDAGNPRGRTGKKTTGGRK